MTEGILLHKDVGLESGQGFYMDYVVVDSGLRIILRRGIITTLHVGSFSLIVDDPEDHFEILTGFTKETFDLAYLGLAMACALDEGLSKPERS